MSPTVMLVIGVVVLVVIVGAIFALRPKPTEVEDRLGHYSDTGAFESTYLDIEEPEESRKAFEEKRKSVLAEKLNDLLQNRGLGSKTRTQLARSNIKLNVGEFFALRIIAAFGGALVGGLIQIGPECSGAEDMIACLTGGFRGAMLVAMIGAVVGFIAPNFFVNMKIKSRLRAFDNQLADTLGLMVNAMRAGFSVTQAMEAVSKEAPPPVSEEFRRVVQEIQLGLSMPDALDHLLDRIRSDDLDLVVTAINVQREVGGNLAEILDVMAFTIRERVRIKGEIVVLTSQGMMTGSVISGLPFALMGVLYLINRPYISEFWQARNQPLGFILLGIGVTMIAVGWAIIRKVVTIEV